VTGFSNVRDTPTPLGDAPLGFPPKLARWTILGGGEMGVVGSADLDIEGGKNEWAVMDAERRDVAPPEYVPNGVGVVTMIPGDAASCPPLANLDGETARRPVSKDDSLLGLWPALPGAPTLDDLAR
jgi:hypothetical protein